MALGWAGCSSTNGKPKGAKRSAGEKVTVFATTEVKGQLEPCGCNSDPLGDIARTVALVEDARAAGPTLVVDGGSLLFQHTDLAEAQVAAETTRAVTIAGLYGDELSASIGLGPYDLAGTKETIAPARHAINVPAESGIPLVQPQLMSAGKVKIGVFGVVGTGILDKWNIEVGDPIAATKTAVDSLRKQGADVVIALAHMQKAQAKSLALKVPGIDFVVVGQNAPEPVRVNSAPDQAGKAWLIQPANRGQVVSRLELTVRGEGPFVDAIGPARAKAEREQLEQRITDLETQLAEWQKDPNADKGFLGQKQKELAELKAEHEALGKQALRVPESGNYFTFEQVRIAKSLPCDTETVALKKDFDRATGQINLTQAKAKGPEPEPAAGKAGFVGMEECGFCHAEAVEFWKTTVHAKAWETLTDLGKDLSYDCVKCHVTGWEQPGGSNLAFHEGLVDVQCEVCHGPGSVHVEEDGKDSPRTIVRTPTEDVCVRCHNPEHSDTFAFEPYLRNVTGKGHGEEFRAKLGDGPTGHELRSAALEKAGRALGKGCPK